MAMNYLDDSEAQRYPSQRHVPTVLSLLLLLRPALHWEGRSGDGLSAYIDVAA